VWRDDSKTFNIFLIGNALSIILALLGAFIAAKFSLLDFLAMIKR